MIRCNRCGDWSENGSNFCQTCGANFEELNIETKRRKNKRILTVSILVLIIVGICGFIAYREYVEWNLSYITSIGSNKDVEYQFDECVYIEEDNRLYTTVDVNFVKDSHLVSQPRLFAITDNGRRRELKRVDDYEDVRVASDSTLHNCYVVDSLDDYSDLVILVDDIKVKTDAYYTRMYDNYIQYLSDYTKSDDEVVKCMRDNMSAEAKSSNKKKVEELEESLSELESSLNYLESLEKLGEVETWEDLNDWYDEYGDY